MASMSRSIQRRKTAVAYGRYSSNNQREESIDAQLRAIREYCEKENIELIEVFTDEAITGKTDDREDFQNMINQLLKEHLQVDYVLVHKFNRFARSKFDSALYKKRLKDVGIKVVYMHNEIKTLERTQIIYELRKGKYDVLVGINLLREGLDVPEVSLIAIFDADKPGLPTFLRHHYSPKNHRYP